MPNSVPTDDDSRPKIELRVGLDDQGHLYLYDAVTGRQVARERGVTFSVHKPYWEESDEVHDLTTVDVEVYADPRLCDEDAIEAIRNGTGDWHVDEL